MQNNCNINMNKVYLLGIVKSKPIFSHNTFGNDFYKFELAVKRLSGYCDLLPITIPGSILKEIIVNAKLEVFGQLRSYNIVNGSSNRLMLTVFTKKISKAKLKYVSANEICLEGYICKNPVYRITPFKREICDLILAVNRSYGKSDYIPMIAWGKNACISQGYKTGQKVKISGRVQSRAYKKVLASGEEVLKTAYEVSISTIEKTQ